MSFIFLSFRNMVLQRKRHLLIALSIVLISSLITVITGLLHSALVSIKVKASRYFAGTTSITGYIDLVPSIHAPEHLIKALEESKLPLDTVAPRTTYYSDNATIFFNGESIRQRKLIGIDLLSEGDKFKTLSFIEGGLESFFIEGAETDGILISVSAANLLGCRVGDELLLSLTTYWGQHNTAHLIVRGIFDETSLFGYVAYINRIALNRLLAQEPGFATDIAIYANAGIDSEIFTENVRKVLANRFDLFPRFSSREERDAALFASGPGAEKYVVLSQNAQLAEIKQLLDSLKAVTYFILAIFLMIVMVGILNTYRVMVHSRTREIGTLRAIGIDQRGILALFLTEAAFLALISAILGLILGITLFRLLTFVNFSFIPAAGLFLEGGHLRFTLDPKTLVANVGLMIAAALFAAWGPSRQAAHIAPADALRSS